VIRQEMYSVCISNRHEDNRSEAGLTECLDKLAEVLARR
jgi:hypothetical protein